ncbi:MAG: hypothetical protein IT176_03910 [Acidobacteria bacterium]|nr:hypothetical protein [Acidobacteriota bacterium]
MSDQQAVAMLEQYRAALEAQIALLRQLDGVARRQREVSEARDFERLAAASDERDRLTRCLVGIEQGLSQVRETLRQFQHVVVAHDVFRHVAALRETAADLVARILATDRESMKALADAELARRTALASLERGETTLAAYRKILTPPVSSAGLLSRRG